MRRVTTEIFIKRATARHGNKFDYSESDFQGFDAKIKIKCNDCGLVAEVSPGNHLQGVSCRACNYSQLPQNQARSHSDYEKMAFEAHGDKFTLLSKYVNKRTKIQVQCSACKTISHRRPDSHLKHGCARCAQLATAQAQAIPVAVFEERCRKVHKDRYEYFQDYKSGRRSIKIRCKIHDAIFTQNASAHLDKRQGCKLCRHSKGEEAIRETLDSLGVKYEIEKRFPDCRNRYPLPFDFYIPEINACIEYDGELHYNVSPRLGGEKRLAWQKASDQKKTEYCREKGIALLRIPYWEKENISEIVCEFLKNKENVA